MLTFFNLPNPVDVTNASGTVISTGTMTYIGDYSSAMFEELLPVLYVVAGLLIGGMLVSKVIKATMGGAKKVMKK